MKIVKGFTLVETLVAIAAAFLILGFLVTWFLDDAEAEQCTAKLNEANTVVALAANQPGDYVLCAAAKNRVEEFNEACGAILPALPVPVC